MNAGHRDEVVRITDKVIQTLAADQNIDDGLASERSGFLQLRDDVGQAIAALEIRRPGAEFLALGAASRK